MQSASAGPESNRPSSVGSAAPTEVHYIEGIGVGSDSPLDLRDDGMTANLDGQNLAQLENEEIEINNL